MPIGPKRPVDLARPSEAKPALVSVWDPFVRIAHWVLVVAFVVVYVSSVDQRAGRSNLHVWIGYGMGALILLRLIWGFIGPRHARFSDFIFRRPIVFNYFKDVFLGSPRRYLGHSPAGGAIIMALMVALAASVVTGIATYGGFGGGVLARVLGALHETMAVLAVILAILHVLGITIASITHRENLIAAMFTGKKRLED
jgi:cytochrome b